MIDIFYFSIAGKKSNNQVDDLVQTFLDCVNLPIQERKILQHVQRVAKNGSYPSEDYFVTFYAKSAKTYVNLSELKTYCQSVIEFYNRQSVERSLIKDINETETLDELVQRLSVYSEIKSSSGQVIAPSFSYGKFLNYKFVEGIKTGVSELDEITHGFQPGLVASICAFTGQGKSTFATSVAFNNALDRKPVIFFSLEVSPEIIWLQLEARYMYQVKGLQVTTSDLQFRTLSKEMEEKVLSFEGDFQSEIGKYIVIVDESILSKQILLNYKSFSSLIRNIEESNGLEGVSLMIFDHVGQFELMFPECGNQIIKSIQSVTKTYKDSRDIRPVTLMAVQANRQGEMRARKRQGLYDLQAISDLNEVERTSAYVITLFTSDDLKIMQETKLAMIKNRTGRELTPPVTVAFNPAVLTVGASVESVSLDADAFNALDLDLGDFSL